MTRSGSSPTPKAKGVPRPPNCWILYRSDKRKELGKMHENEASKMISARWKSEVPHVRAKYEQLANEKKEEHTRMYPDYRFSPVKKEEKERLRAGRKREKEEKKASKRECATHRPTRSEPPTARNYSMADAPSPSYSEPSWSRVTSASPRASPYPQTPWSRNGSPVMPPAAQEYSSVKSENSPPSAEQRPPQGILCVSASTSSDVHSCALQFCHIDPQSLLDHPERAFEGSLVDLSPEFEIFHLPTELLSQLHNTPALPCDGSYHPEEFLDFDDAEVSSSYHI